MIRKLELPWHRNMNSYTHLLTALAFSYLCSDAIVSQVLDELGLQMTEGLSDLPSAAGTLGTTTPASKTPVAVTDAADDDIQARLDNLRRE